MSEVRACESCRHSAEAPIDRNNLGAPRALLCKRYPPAVQLIHVGNGQMVSMAADPTVPPGAVCGEWCPPL